MGLSPRTLRPANNFTPRSISGLALWLDASDASTLFQDAAATTPATETDNPVGAWLDKSGNGRHVTQATAGSRPTISATKQNGRNALAFNGSSQSLSIASYNAENGLSGLTRYVVASMSSPAASAISRVTTGGGDSFFATVSSDLRFYAGASAYSAVASTNYGLLTSGTNIIGSVYDGTAGSVAAGIKPYYNGAAIPPSSTSGTLPTTLPSGTPGFWIGSNLGVNSFWPGRIVEYISYSRALGNAERQRLERYLAAKYGITLAPQVSNADAQDWINRVYANGGQVSAATAASVNTLCDSLDAASLRDRFYRLNLFCGSNLNAALVPLYRGPSLGGTQYGNTTDTNQGPFATGAYTEATGLTPVSASGNYLDTGLTPDAMPLSVVQAMHLAFSHGPIPAQGTNVYPHMIGAASAADRHYLGSFEMPTSGSAALVGQLGKAATTNAPVLVGANPSSRWVVSRTSATSLAIYQNGSLVNTNTSSTTGIASYSRAISVFRTNFNGTLIGDSVAIPGRHYSIGAGLTVAEVSAYSSALSSFFSAIGRTA
jgi:hypothetical protein